MKKINEQCISRRIAEKRKQDDAMASNKEQQ